MSSQQHQDDTFDDSMSSTTTAAVMSTADDALTAKHATVAAGYYPDEFIAEFAATTAHQQRRSVQPIIKRGTHARVACMDRAISKFSRHHHDNGQIVVLGAGMDTSFLRHRRQDATGCCRAWFEVDLASVMHRKKRILERHLQKWNLEMTFCQKEEEGFVVTQQTTSSADNSNDKRTCTCLSHDLRSPGLVQKLSRHGFQPSQPALFVAECVQMYLPDETTRTLWKEIATSCPNATVILYDPILQSDPFGKVMEQHLLRAGVLSSACSMSQTRTVQDHLDKMAQCYFTRVVACDMWQAYHTVVTREQQFQANQAEFLDELEEWTLLMQHYCLVVATNNTQDDEGLCAVGRDSPMGFSENICQVSVTK